VRNLAGQELALPSWEHAVAEDWLGKWAMNLMLINVSKRCPNGVMHWSVGDAVFQRRNCVNMAHQTGRVAET
jgi:hypothetical protein